ncbi:hypothetical protein HYC85_019631 [Camellia sinensis]|uniref:Uncharacterized protein n=1 Tax=Camellia sinensis TaxID=4442 RepID=A0A7J7GMH0_CAMSI|nr:hypothetical protein HYC85_019631 [Camellia sinensis]
MTKASSQTLPGLNFVSFSDGYDDGFKLSDNHEHFRSENKCHGSKALSELIKANSVEGFLITGVIEKIRLIMLLGAPITKIKGLCGVLGFEAPIISRKWKRLHVDSEKQEDKLSCKEKLEKQGLIEPWCSQVEVFSHPSVGCFVTHCGWNFTLESLVLGILVVCLPVKDISHLAIVKAPPVSFQRPFPNLPAREGGSSDKNLRTFVDEIEGGLSAGVDSARSIWTEPLDCPGGIGKVREQKKKLEECKREFKFNYLDFRKD